MTPTEAASIVEAAHSISPSWGASVVDDPDSPSGGGVSVGAVSGSLDHPGAEDTYWIARVRPNQVTVSNMRDDFATLGTFRTVHEAVEAMKAHAALVRY